MRRVYDWAEWAKSETMNWGYARISRSPKDQHLLNMKSVHAGEVIRFDA